jgi:hypothetical protein
MCFTSSPLLELEMKTSLTFAERHRRLAQAEGFKSIAVG